MADPKFADALRVETRAAWHRYLDLLVAFRPQLHAYCRKLTGNIWDGEDLLHDTLLKGFASMGLTTTPIENPRGYLTRIATNLWIDMQRRRESEARALALESVETEQPRITDRKGALHAGARLLETLAPQEQAAVVLKDVLDMNLKEIAEILLTTEGAVKAALHRGRERLKTEPRIARRHASPELVERFANLLNASDLQGLIALMLDGGRVEMSSTLVEHGRDEYTRKGSWLWQAVNVHPDMPADERPPKWINEITLFHGEPVVLSFMPPPFKRTLQSVTRLEEAEGKIARIRSYCFSPETVGEVAAELSLQCGLVPHRFPGD
jgi:RNA polymerase sigma-70 factor (ECF subfamily)